MIETNIFWLPNNLKVVCEYIDKECAATSRFPLNNQFSSLLETLDYIERSFVADYFCKLPWNVSSVRVLGSLNRLRILSATEYILSQTNDEHIQLVLNDFLETEFDLIANLIICGHYDLMVGSKITEYVDDSIRRLFADLSKNPKLNNLEYIRALKGSLPKELHAKLVQNHMKIVLSMDKGTTKAAFACFAIWMKQKLEDYELEENFYKKALAENDFELVKTLLSTSSGVHFHGWKKYLVLLGIVIKNGEPECISFVKKWLKDRFKVVADTGSRETMAHLLLSIRVVFLFQLDKTETYTKWYKQNIGDMKFVCNASQFKTIIEVLSDLVPYETDVDYLEVHVKTSISPPQFCGQMCRDYKALCRTRISDLEANTMMELDEDLFPEIE